MAPSKIMLANIGGGELNELVERELSRICENVADPNIKAEAVRTVKVEIKIRPDKKRQTAEVIYSVKSLMPGPDASKMQAFIAMEHGEMALYSMDIRQGDMPFMQEPVVTEIRQLSPVTDPTSQPAKPSPPPKSN